MVTIQDIYEKYDNNSNFIEEINKDIQTLKENKILIIYPEYDLIQLKGYINSTIGVYGGIDFTDQNNKIYIKEELKEFLNKNLGLKVYHNGKIILGNNEKYEYKEEEYTIELNEKYEYIDLNISNTMGGFICQGKIIQIMS